MKTLILILSILSAAPALAQVIHPAQPAPYGSIEEYPRVLRGKKRVVLQLPALADEVNHKVQLILARDLAESDCNYKGLSGTLEKVEREINWLTFYEVKSDGGFTATRMGCLSPPKPDTIYGQSLMIPYRSSEPIVVYVTDKVYVQYRIWKTDGEYKKLN